MQCERAPDVLGISLSYRILFQFKPGRRHVLECVLGCLPFCLRQLATLFFRVDALSEKFSGFDRFLPGLSEREFWVGAEAHIDAVFGNRLPIVEVP
ncbi:hypothetical protein D3C75_1195920 [compost metagenome]